MRGTGRVFKRTKRRGGQLIESPIWHIAVFYRDKEYRTSAHTTKKSEAQKLLAMYMSQVARSEFKGFPTKGKDSRLTLAEILTITLDDAEVRELRDVYHMRFRAEHLKDFFGAEPPVEEITETTIAKYVATRRKAGIKLSTVNRELAVLRQALRLAIKRRLIPDMPQIDRFEEHNVRMVFFEAEVYEAIQSHVPEVLQDMMRFAYLTGWRKGQITRLEWKDVHSDGVIRLPGTTVKHKDVQVLRLVGELAEVIERRRQARHLHSPWVFHRNGRPIKDFRYAWNKALEKAGVSDYVFHDFRRTATRNMTRAQVPGKRIMQVTGHKTLTMLDRYSITVEQDTEETLAQTQAYLAQQRQARLGRQSHTQGKTGK